MKASILLLTKDAGPVLEQLLHMLGAQDIEAEVETLAIDSGSSDGTLRLLSRHNVRVIEIQPSEFGHGATRNLAARHADIRSKYLVYLTQDAVPADSAWLAKLLTPMVNDPGVAGTFSRHLPRPGASPSLVRQLTTQWQSGGGERLVKRMPDDPDEYEAHRDYYTYFSNTSSCLRRDVWEQIPFREVAFAEDADWADRVLRAGHKIVFEPTSLVVHSHDYSIIEQFRQNVDHTEAMVSLFDPPSLQSPWLLLRQLQSVPHEVWRDLKFMRHSDYFAGSPWWKQLSWMVRSPFWYLASFAGGWVGTRMRGLPASWRKLLGRQERIRRGISSD